MNANNRAARQALLPRAIAIAIACGAAAPLCAQTASNHGANDLEEIVVTATRRSEVLSKVPVSVTAISQESMDARGMKDMQDIARYTPGVSFDNTGTNAISIRGISSSGGAGTTGIYLDDTPIQMRSVGFNPDDSLPKSFDLERVEILRGPQGTLFGAGSEGGTVRYLFTPPKVHGSSTYARGELSYTENGEASYELGVAHGATLIDGTLGIRASAWFRNDGGWIDRVDPTTRAVTERGANHADAYMLRLAAVWQPSSSVTLTPSVVYQHSNKHDQSTYWPAYSNPDAGHFNNATPEHIPVPDKYFLPSVKLEISLPNSQIISNSSYYSRDELSGYQGTVYDLSFYQTFGWGYGTCGPTSVAAAPPCDWYPLIDTNGLHLPAGFENYQTPNIITNTQRSWTQELRWQSTNEQSKWRWTLGLFWQQSKEVSIEELKDDQINEFFQYLYGTDAISQFGDYYSCPGHPGTYTAIPACDIYYNNNQTTDRQTALFGEVSYALTDKLRATIGDRVARTTFSIDHYGDGLENYGPNPPPLPPHDLGHSSETPNTPKFNLSYQANDRNLYYATVAKGFRAGGGNAPLPPYCHDDLIAAGYANGAPLTYKSDSTDSYELGTKNNLGRGFNVATSVYYIKWNDIQQSVYISGNCALQFTTNLGTAVAKGFDLQAEIVAGPMKLDLTAGYTDARYTRTVTVGGNISVSAGDAISGQGAIDGGTGLGSPWTAALGTEYDFKLAEHPSYVRFDIQYASRNNWLSPGQDPNSSQYNYGFIYPLPSNIYAQLRAGLTVGGWEMSAFIDNLSNSHTVTGFQLGVVDGTTVIPPEQNQYTFRPRTFGLTAALHR